MKLTNNHNPRENTFVSHKFGFTPHIRLCGGFTLLELLIVVGIVGTLATAVAMVLKPAELLNSSRDVKRMSELGAINKLLSLYRFENTSGFGSSSVVYYSLPDDNSDCSSWTLPDIPSGWTRSCKPESEYRKTNGTGWVPVDFNNISFSKNLPSLPVDPINNQDSYFTYNVSGDNQDNWELTAKLLSESKKGLALNIKDGGDDDNRYELGAVLAGSGSGTTEHTYLVYNPSESQIFIGVNQAYAQGDPANGYVSFFTDATHITGVSDLFWDNTNTRLGIGIATPSYKLHLNDSNDSIFGIKRVGSTYPVVFKQGTDGNFVLNVGNSDRMVITNGGNVGIGTTVPGVKLDVLNSAGGTIVRIYNTGTNGAAGYAATPVLDVSSKSGGTFTAGHSIFRVGRDDSASNTFNVNTTLFTVLGSGNVGIGTTGPVSALEVSGTSPYLTLSNSLTDVPINTMLGILNFYSNDTSTNSKGGVASVRAYSETAYNSGATPSYMSFYTHTGSVGTDGTVLGNPTERMRITSTGNVGIGTTAPNSKLEVAGTIHSTSGGIKFPDNTTQTTAASSGTPAGAVMFFNLSSCPSGWTALAAAQGRYLVGLPSAGTLAGTAGTALSNGENRAVGQHNHTITDPGHSHGLDVTGNDLVWTSALSLLNDVQMSPIQTSVVTTGISVQPSGSVAGTNAPYIQFLVCQKD